MRWIVLSLLIFNAVFLLWNGLEYRNEKLTAAINAGFAADMPGARLVLVQEAEAAAKPALAAPQAPPPPVAPPPPPLPVEAEQCAVLGPFSEINTAKLLADKLAAQGIAPKFAAKKVENEPDYWVYLKPQISPEMAADKLRELRGKNIDSFIVNTGDMVNGISLGVFGKKEDALRYQASLKTRGYDAQMRANSRTHVDHWLVLYSGEAAKFHQTLYDQLRAANNKLEWRKEACDKVASEMDIH